MRGERGAEVIDFGELRKREVRAWIRDLIRFLDRREKETSINHRKRLIRCLISLGLNDYTVSEGIRR